MSPWRIRQIAYRIRQGALIAYPTDTIWGLGCHPLCDQTINRLQQLKQRPTGKGLILLSSNIDFCQYYIDEKTLTEHYERLSQPQPTPVTWVVKASKECPQWLTGKSTTIAIRITHKPLIRQLCSVMRSPLTSTSANFSGRPASRNSLQVHRNFQHRVDFILKGFDHHSVHDSRPQASQIRDIHTNKIFRA
jgi:L-threonylcarbamoyladenylate synthase